MRTGVLISCAAALVLLGAVLAEELVYRDGDYCYPMPTTNVCQDCNSLGMSMKCREYDDDDEPFVCTRSTYDCVEDRSGDYTDIVRIPCALLPQCGIGYASAYVESFEVDAESSLVVQRLSSSKAGFLALTARNASFLGILNTLLFSTEGGNLLFEGNLDNGTYTTNAGECHEGQWCSAPGGLTYRKDTLYYNDSSIYVPEHSPKNSPFSSRLLPGELTTAENTLLLDIESTPVRLSTDGSRNLWLKNSYITTRADDLDDLTLELLPGIALSHLSFDASDQELDLQLTVNGRSKSAVNDNCRLLGSYEEHTLSRCEFSFEVSSYNGSYFGSSSSYYYSSSSDSSYWYWQDGEVETVELPAFTLFD